MSSPRDRFRDLGEFGLIARLAARTHGPHAPGVVGIGDDCAAFPFGDRTLLATTDTLVDGVHFRSDWVRAEDIGWKALAASLSDIAAMGGEPRFALVSLGLNADADPEWVEGVYAGFDALLHELRRDLVCPILGGDTFAAPGDTTIGVTVVGEAVGGRYVTRAGARPGDLLVVTGFLGDSRAGLGMLQTDGLFDLPEAPPGIHPLVAFWDPEGGKRIPDDLIDEIPLTQLFLSDDPFDCLHAHLRPVPQVSVGRIALDFAHAMIDLSDGLSGDVRHLARASGVGVEIDEALLPMTCHLASTAALLGCRPEELALEGGEDYVLLMAISPNDFEALDARVEPAAWRVTAIGGVTDHSGEIVLIDQDRTRVPLPNVSWDHFGKGGG